jgi:hypothetical protein
MVTLLRTCKADGVARFAGDGAGVRFVNNRLKKAILVEGGGEGSIPVNTLYTEPQALFADPSTHLLQPQNC